MDEALERACLPIIDAVVLMAPLEQTTIPARLRAAGCQVPILALVDGDAEARTWLQSGLTDVWNRKSDGWEPLERALRYAALRPEFPAIGTEEPELTRTLLAHFPNGSVYLLDLESRILLADGLGLAPIELSPELVQGKWLREVFGEEEIYPAWARAVQHAVGGCEYYLEGRVRGRWRGIRTAPVRNEAGQITSVLAVTQDITDRKRAEEALEHSEARFRAFMDNIPTPVFIVDENGRYVFLNRAIEKQVEKTSEELLGNTIFERLPEEMASALWANSLMVLRENRAMEFDETVLGADGEPRQQIVVKFPLQGPDGRRYVAGVALDVTERTRVEAALRRSESRLARAQAMAHLGHIEGWVGSQEIKWSDEVYRIFGYEPQSFVPTYDKLMQLIHPDDWDMWLEQRHRRDITKTPVDYKIRLIRRDGSIRWAHINNTPVLDDNGELTGFEGTVLDITDLQELEDQLESFFALAEDMFCICDFQGRLTYLNPAWEKMLGYSVAESLGRPFMEFVSPEDLSQTKEELERILEGRGSAYFENRYVCRDGSVKWIRWSTAVDKTHSLVFAVASDVTSRKEAESALLRVRDELEQRVAERTRQLESANQSLKGEIAERQLAVMTLRHTVQDLEAARDEAQRANAAKSEFLSRMSHELRTPMNSILGFAQLMEMSPHSPKQEQRVASILAAGQHLLHLINDVLDLSRVESGRLQLTPESVSAGSAVATAVSLMRPIAEKRGIAISQDGLVSGSHPVLADPQRLSQVLLNLLSNAVKYNREGGSVDITCAQTPAHLRIQVRDTGPGIAGGDLPRLFVPFERLNATRNEAEGTGLGLALSKGLVEAMGGTLGVESELGAGCTFWFDLPTAQENRHLSAVAPAEDDMDLGDRPISILYIEDNLANYQVMEDLLENYPGVKLMGAMQGSLGVDLAREHRPGLILLDLHLPDIPGQEVLRRLRAEPATAGVPVVVVSADATPTAIDELLNSGATDFVTKPLDVRRLIQVIQRILEPEKPMT